MDSSVKQRRAWPWVLAVAGELGAVAALNLSDLVGDAAVVNVLTLLLLVLTAATLVAWCLVAGTRTWRAGLVVLAAVLAVPAIFLTIFKVEGVRGDLTPRFALRFGTSAPLAPPKIVDVPDESPVPSVDLRTTTPDDFPQFLGPHRTNSLEHPTLESDWDAEPPEQVWKRPIGAGWAGFAVVNGFAVTLEQHGDEELVTCYEVANGALRWKHPVAARYESVIAGTGPRSTSTIDEGRVYTLGATGILSCLDGATGEVVWDHDLLAMFDVTLEDEQNSVRFGRANSPLVVGDLVVVPVGGPRGGPHVSLAAFDKQTGEPAWTAGGRNASYSSPVLAKLAGVPQILIVNEDTLSSHDPQTGETLWEVPWPGNSGGDANVSQAMPVEPNRVFVSKGYFRGAILIEVKREAEGHFETSTLWQSSQVLKTKFTNVVIHNGYVYGLSDGILECVDLKNGKRAWKAGRYGHGQILRVGGLLLVLAESGEMLLLELSSAVPNKVLGRFQALTGTTWNTFALAGPLLLVRNGEEAACYRLPVAKPRFNHVLRE